MSSEQVHSFGKQGDVPIRVSPNKLSEFVTLIFKAFGSNEKEQAALAHHLVGANLTGHDSHGVMLIPMYAAAVRTGRYGVNTPLKRMPTQHKEDHMIVCNGFITTKEGKHVRAFGQRAFREAIEIGCDEAKKTGISLVSFRESGHVGRLGTYGEIVTEKGFAAILMAAVSDHGPLVAVHGGSEPVCCTNPLCIAFPTNHGNPFLLDFATSKVSFGKIKNMVAKGITTSEPNLFLDKDGKPSQNPIDMLGSVPGALLPFGEHKGSGLMIAIELLAGALTGGATTHPDHQKYSTDDDKAPCNSALAIIFNIDKMHGDRLMANTFLEYIRNSRRADSKVPIYVPGDMEQETREERTRLGIPVPRSVWENLFKTAKSFGISDSELETFHRSPNARL